MLAFLFGKKKKRSIKKSPKLSKAVLKMAKKYKVKVTIRRGSKKVYKPLRIVMKQIKIAKRTHHRRTTRRTSRRISRRRNVKPRVYTKKMHFGGGFFNKNNNDNNGYGPGPDARQNLGNSSYTNSVIQTKLNNMDRPTRIPSGNTTINTTLVPFRPIFGTGKTFFNQTVPSTLPPNWQFMYQKDGSSVALGSPFSTYNNPAFGIKRRRRVHKMKKFD
jgi:hypothetical protein